MHAQPQQVWYLHEQIPPEFPPAPDKTGSAGACFSLSAGAILFNLDPTDLGIQAGEYVIVLGQMTQTGTANDFPFEAAAADALTLGWTCILGRPVNNNGFAAWARHAEAGDTSLNYTFRFVGSPTTGKGCWRLLRFSGVSKTALANYYRRNAYGNVNANSYDSYSVASFIYWPQSPSSGNILTRTIATGQWAGKSSASNVESFYDYPTASAAIDAAYQSFEYLGELAASMPWPLSFRRCSLFTRVVSPAGYLNLAPNNVAIGNGDTTGWSLINLTETDVSSSSRLTTRLRFNGTSTSTEAALVRTIDFVAGNDYWISMRWGEYMSSSTSRDAINLRIIDPSLNVVGGNLRGFFSRSQPIASIGLPLPTIFTIGDGYSGLPDFPYSEYHIRYRATETGTHTIKINFCTASNNLAEERIFGSTNVADYAPFGFAVTKASMACHKSTVGTDDYHENFVPGWGFCIDDHASLSAIDVMNLRDNVDEAYQCEEIELVPANATLAPVRLVEGLTGNAPRLLNDAQTALTDLVNHRAIYSDSNTTLAGVRESLIADRAVHPTYFPTEGGVRTIGKYYFEVEALGTGLANSDAMSFLVAPTNNINPRHGNGGIGSHQTGIGSNGQVVFGTTAAVTASSAGAVDMVAGERIGFALDFESDLISIYRDGSLHYSSAFTNNFASGNLTPWRAAVCIRVHSFAVGFSCNFTGPFVYPKPSGFVAYDYLNEVSL